MVPSHLRSRIDTARAPGQSGLQFRQALEELLNTCGIIRVCADKPRDRCAVALYHHRFSIFNQMKQLIEAFACDFDLTSSIHRPPESDNLSAPSVPL